MEGRHRQAPRPRPHLRADFRRGRRGFRRISARLWSDGYEEHLVVDADTRIPTTYSVERTRT